MKFEIIEPERNSEQDEDASQQEDNPGRTGTHCLQKQDTAKIETLLWGLQKIHKGNGHHQGLAGAANTLFKSVMPRNILFDGNLCQIGTGSVQVLYKQILPNSGPTHPS